MPHKLRGWRAHLPCASAHKKRLSAYLDGELDRDARASLEKHLGACPRCHAQYERLRFASRAISHVVVPQACPPAWRPVARRVQQKSPRTALASFWRMKISVPAPVAVAALALLVCVAAVLSLGPLGNSPMSIEPLPANALVPQIKFIEVPVERERIITRAVSAARASRPVDVARPGSAPDKQQRAALIAAGVERERRTIDRNGGLLTSTSLAGFRPAKEANLRIVKEPEP